MPTVAPLLSVVIPTLDESATLGPLLMDLAAIAPPYEVIVADGGSGDDTLRIAQASGARTVLTRAGRGIQLRTGADMASAPLLCFLHADVRLGADAAARLSRLAHAPPEHACAFRLRIDEAGFRFRLVEAGANGRSRLLGLPYGDQGLVVRRGQYDQVGGFPDLPLMEDVALVRALGSVTRVKLLDEVLVVSARRWRRDGVVHRTVRNWWLLGRYLAGTPPEHLIEQYRPEGRSD